MRISHADAANGDDASIPRCDAARIQHFIGYFGGDSWRRWTGIEPAGRGSPIPPALKAGEPTRRSDTSTPDATAKQETLDGVGSVEAR